MGQQTTTESIESLLASVQEHVDDPELSFKLRTARQKVVLCDDRLNEYEKALDNAEIDQQTLENLRQLGYLN
ncbi:hypothetical protein ACERIT_09180 [Halopenitus sp. H-Gu1]|uniref:hypothetical protein n=1 Tax=Halopenitus sp. H-Gu1 TaxID=3242697 RepID=UPI00359E13FB